MKAVKIIGIVIGGMAVVFAVVLFVVTLVLLQAARTDQEHMQRVFSGPFPGTVVSVSGADYSVDWTDQRVRHHRNTVRDDDLKAEVGSRIEVYYAPDSPAELYLSNNPQLRALAARQRTRSFVAGGSGIVVIIGCSVLLAVGRRRRTDRPSARSTGGPAWPQRKPPNQVPPQPFRQPPPPLQQQFPQQPVPPQPFPPQPVPPQPFPPQPVPPQPFPPQPFPPQPFAQQPFPQQPIPPQQHRPEPSTVYSPIPESEDPGNPD